MWKSCAKCGKIHPYTKKCYAGEVNRKKDTKANKFRQTSEWKNKSEEIRKDSKYLCAVCLDHNIFNYNHIEVHHIEPIDEAYDRRLDNYNLIALCNTCHREAEQGKIDKEYLFRLANAREDGKIQPPHSQKPTESKDKEPQA